MATGVRINEPKPLTALPTTPKQSQQQNPFTSDCKGVLSVWLPLPIFKHKTPKMPFKRKIAIV